MTQTENLRCKATYKGKVVHAARVHPKTPTYTTWIAGVETVTPFLIPVCGSMNVVDIPFIDAGDAPITCRKCVHC